tara:strand:+ start:447 stop:1265 length:819 start_codon:yes stop_codon:yes gene_type:complete
MSLVATEWLENNINKVKIIDSSWHLPISNRDAYKEYTKEHIFNAIFFDLDNNSDQDSDLPHMLPNKNFWEKIVSSLGISNNDEIVVYDNSDLISSCRCWYTFIYFGHDPSLIHVLDGGLKKWKIEKRKTTTRKTKIINSNYIAEEKKDLVKNKKQIDENIINKNFKLIDARNKNRFEGKEPEFRKNVKSGSIPNSICLPYTDLINKNHTFKELKVILFKFNNIFGSKLPKDVVFSCGSGVTAAVLSLAYSLINNKYLPTVYDGSWAEYGKIK